MGDNKMGILETAQNIFGTILKNKGQNQLPNTPWRDAAIQAIMNGDKAKGEEIARNIMSSYGFSSPDEAIQKGMQNITNKR